MQAADEKKAERIGEAQIDAAVRFWGDLFLVMDKREAFKRELRKLLEANATNRCIRLYVDYDPEGLLLEAVRAAGVTCSGFMYSARGIFSCGKTGTTLYPDKVEAKEGYGAPYEQIWP